MPMLYRVLKRLSVLLVVLGFFAWGAVLVILGGLNSIGGAIVVLGVCLIPAALVAGIAWIVRPPLDPESLRRLWRD